MRKTKSKNEGKRQREIKKIEKTRRDQTFPPKLDATQTLMEHEPAREKSLRETDRPSAS